MATKKNVKNKLPTIKSISDKFGKPPAYGMMRNDPDLKSWLHKIFALKKDGELYISNRKLAEEVSSYLGAQVSHHVINKEYHEWLLRNKIG